MNINQICRIYLDMQIFLHHHHQVNIIQAVQFQGRFEVGRWNEFGRVHFKFFLKKIIYNQNNLFFSQYFIMLDSYIG